MLQPVFQGLKVIDCGSFIAGPAAATVLSDLGADVIKIEPPGSGDPYRDLPKLPGNPFGTPPELLKPKHHRNIDRLQHSFLSYRALSNALV